MINQPQHITTERLQELCSEPNVYELEERRYRLAMLKMSLTHLGLDVSMLRQHDDGWFFGGSWLGSSIIDSFLRINHEYFRL